MSGASDKILQGPCYMFTATSGTPLPTRTDIDALLSDGIVGWTYHGRTESGVTMASEPQQEHVTTDETGHPVDSYITGVETFVRADVKSVTADSLRKWLRDTASATGTVGHARVGAVPKHATVFVGQWITGETALFVAPRCGYSGEVEVPFQAGESAAVSVEQMVFDAGDDKVEGGDWAIKVGAEAPAYDDGDGVPGYDDGDDGESTE